MCLVAATLDSIDGENGFERSKNGRAVAVDLEENSGLGIETKGRISGIGLPGCHTRPGLNTSRLLLSGRDINSIFFGPFYLGFSFYLHLDLILKNTTSKWRCPMVR